jgi:primosomal protein N' (replication factor Y)
VCGAVQAGDAHEIASILAQRIAPPDASVLGPAPLFRLRGRARSQVVVKGENRAAAIRAVGDAVEQTAREAARRTVSVSVDVDPQ